MCSFNDDKVLILRRKLDNANKNVIEGLMVKIDGNKDGIPFLLTSGF